MEPMISVIVPCSNQVRALSELRARLRDEFDRLQVAAEIIFIDDGSRDSSRGVLRELSAADPACRAIFFRQPCGAAAALQAGLAIAQGEYIVTLGPDVPEDVAEITRVLEALQSADVVVGWRGGFRGVHAKALSARLLHAAVRRVSGARLHDVHAELKGYRRVVIREITAGEDRPDFLPVLAAARGFRVSELSLPAAPRRYRSPYGWDALISDLMDLLAVAYLAKYRVRPLRLFGSLGVGFTLFGLALGAVLSPYLTTTVLRPPAWHFFMWLLATACVVLGPLFIAIGVLAEGQAAARVRYTPPIAERLNVDAATPVSRP